MTSFPLTLIRLRGNSLTPAYRDGQLCVVYRTRAENLRCGDAVIARTATFGLIAKIIARTDPARRSVDLAGISAESTPAVRMENIAWECLEGKIIFPRRRR